MNDQKQKSVMIAGGGISGVCAAIRLAETGCHVYLVEKSPYIGGILTRLDHQFPNNGCGMCRMLPMQNRNSADPVCLRKGLFHVNIDVLPLTEIRSVSGVPGNLSVNLIRHLQGVDPESCVGCGKCDEVCPVAVPNEFNCRFSSTKAIFAPLPHQYPAKRIIDLTTCTRCGECVKVCPTQAIDFNLTVRSAAIEDIAGIILCQGTDLYQPDTPDLYGFGAYPNVVTSTAFERMLSSSGPFSGKLMRPSDGGPIKKIAWAQCVGSRNLAIGADYCSSACCMISIKEAVLFYEKHLRNSEVPRQDLSSAIFYMDMRTFGRDFQRYRDKAESEYGVRFIRSRIHSIEQENDAGDLKVRYVNSEGKLEEEIVDLVVLAAGQNPKRSLPDFSDHDGVFVMDRVRELKDIAESVITAHAAAARLFRTMTQKGIQISGHDGSSDAKTAASLPVFQQKPIIQVILFENDAPEVNWRRVSENLSQLPGKVEPVSLASVLNPKDWAQIEALMTSGKANRWVLTSCYPYPLWSQIKDLACRTGVSETLTAAADVHPILQDQTDSDALSDAVFRCLEMTVEQVRNRRMPASYGAKPLNHTALIIGAGPAGLSAALTLADSGADVVVVEKTGCLGGNLASCRTPDLKASVDTLIRNASNHPKITILTTTQAVSSSKSSGQFTTVVKDSSGKEQSISHGAVIIASGGRGGAADVYGLGTHDRIVSQFDFETILYDPAFSDQPLHQVVMIQCAGCREEPKNYCSRVCCQKSLIHALRIKDLHPNAEVMIFYRDMMTYGQSEQLYTEARRKKILFFPFEKDRKPDVRIENGAPVVVGFDPYCQEAFTVQPDWISLAVGVEPNPIEPLLSLFHVQTTPDGFVQEADSKWRPVDTNRSGVFIAGLARNPVRGDEAMKEGDAAAIRAWAFLTASSCGSGYPTAIVRHSLCSRCELCIDACPYHARFRDAEWDQIVVDPTACQGCGACAAVCPNSASIIGNFEDGSMMRMIEAAL